MSAAAILTIIGIVNGLIAIAKELPEAKKQAQDWLAKIEPYIKNAGVDVETAFAQAQQKVAAL